MITTDLGERRACAYALLAVAILCAGMLVPRYTDFSLGHGDMLAVHLLMELFAIIIAILIVVTTWHTFDSGKDRSSSILIGGFLIVACCDLMHALTYAGMPPLLSPSSTPRAIFFWLIGRSIEVATLALVALHWAPRLSRGLWLGIGVLVSAIIVWIGSYHVDAFPVTFVPGQGVTAFKAGYEFALTLANVMLAVLFWRNAKLDSSAANYQLALSCFVMGMGGIMFTAYVTPSDFQNIFGHVFKIAAYAIFYNAIFVGKIRAPFQRLIEAEKRLRSSEKSLQLFIDYAPAALAMLDRNMRYLSVSQRWKQEFGMGNRDVRGLQHYDVFPDVPAHWKEAHQLALAGRPSRNDAEYVRLPDGSSHWIRGEVLPWNDLQGNIGGIIIFSEDLSEIRESEAALRESEREFRTLTNAMPQIVWATRPDGWCVYLNQQWTDYTGLTAEESHGQNWIRPFHPDDQQRAWDAWQQATRNKATYAIECRLRRADGAYRWWLIRGVSVHDENGNITKWLGTCTDIDDIRQAETKRTQLEAQLRESQKMEAIGTLAGGIAHDFNNIISIILGNAKLARQDAGANPQMQESLEQILKAGTRARNLVRQILSFGRRQPTDLKPVTLSSIVHETTSLLRASLPARVSLDVQCSEGVPPVLADATQMEQILINLATNAMQAMHGAPGCISIHLDTVSLDAALAGGNAELMAMRRRGPEHAVRLTVSDTGRGMNPGTLARIFEPFFTTKPANQGTGLGLSVVRGIVQGHAGVITASSTPGYGATFTIYLPAASASAVTAGSNNAATEPGQPNRELHVLYIDDDDALAFLVKRLLERHAMRVTTHVDVREALDELRKAPAKFNIVLTDYNMPQMSGLDVARAVRAIRADLPVVVATGFIDETLRTESAQAGVRELLFKADIAETFCDDVIRLAQAIRKV